MATITKSIGATSRDYSTIAAWEADLSDTDIYASGDNAAGDCYADSDFTENVDISGTFDLSSIALTAAFPDRHDGTAGSGVVIKPSSTASYAIRIAESNTTISFIEMNGNASGYLGFWTHASETGIVFRNNLVHNFGSSSGASADVYVMKNNNVATFMNNFVSTTLAGQVRIFLFTTPPPHM